MGPEMEEWEVLNDSPAERLPALPKRSNGGSCQPTEPVNGGDLGLARAYRGHFVRRNPDLSGPGGIRLYAGLPAQLSHRSICRLMPRPARRTAWRGAPRTAARRSRRISSRTGLPREDAGLVSVCTSLSGCGDPRPRVPCRSGSAR